VLDENVRLRTGLAVQTLDFFEQEVGRLGEDLSRQSARILEFKNQNINALPERHGLPAEPAVDADGAARAARARPEQRSRDMRDRMTQMFQATGQLPGPRRARDARAAALIQARRELESGAGDLLGREPARPGADGARRAARARGRGIGRRRTRAATRPALFEHADERDRRARGVHRGAARRSSRRSLRSWKTRSRGRPRTRSRCRRSSATTRTSAVALQRRDPAACDRGGGRADRTDVEGAAHLGPAPGGRAAGAGQPQPPPDRRRGWFAGLGAAGALVVLLELLNRTVRRPADLTRALQITPLGDASLHRDELGTRRCAGAARCMRCRAHRRRDSRRGSMFCTSNTCRSTCSPTGR
jgi:hypothetical protein